MQKYFQIFSWGDETTFFLCFPLSSLSFKRPILPLRRRLLFLRMCRRARQENDEARRRGKYKIKLWQHWAAAGNVWLYVGWIFPSQYKSLGRWAPKKKEERYTGKKKRNKKILKKIEEKENFFSSSSLPFHIRYKSFFGLYKYMNTEDKRYNKRHRRRRSYRPMLSSCRLKLEKW